MHLTLETFNISSRFENRLLKDCKPFTSRRALDGLNIHDTRMVPSVLMIEGGLLYLCNKEDYILQCVGLSTKVELSLIRFALGLLLPGMEIVFDVVNLSDNTKSLIISMNLCNMSNMIQLSTSNEESRQVLPSRVIRNGNIVRFE
jgi:hypothetical protein